MTGFGRAEILIEGISVQSEVRSVNGRGLDVRTRLASGFEQIETDLRRILGKHLTRGSVTLSLSAQRESTPGEIVVNRQALDTVLDIAAELGTRIDARRPSIDGILALKGVLEPRDRPVTAQLQERLDDAARQCVDAAALALAESRAREGVHLGALITARLDEIANLTASAEAHPSRTREAILARLTSQVEMLLQSENGLSEDRLHAEAVLLATKADIREELDRLVAHVAAARALLQGGGPVGRKLDFLSQEFNREANTLCSKSNDVSLTAIGLDLKAAIDQLREQVQNLE
ncbi:YicC/YloC family endoribonuclease [Pelagibacterium montanilacus]|uniref:YicC/YloC family endoribonuclease n=1 Tax=Pelagibacterium montanilacus TaxID=2185280 RepID=UPI0013DEA4ED